jgi:hypothetical protein
VTLPPLDNVEIALRNVSTSPSVPAEIVVRDALTDAVLSRCRVGLPIFDKEDKSIEMSLQMTYLMTRLEYDPAGRWVYFCTRNLALAVNPATGDQRSLAVPAMTARLSPDGKTLAVLQKGAIGFVGTDGRKATYVRLENTPAFNGLAWVDNATLAMLRAPVDSEKQRNASAVLERIAVDGRALGSQIITLPGPTGDDMTVELAMGADGKHMVISYAKQVYFMRRDGTVLKTWGNEKKTLVRPTFSPDSRRVAFKFREGENDGQVSAIVFFTPEGKELSRVAIPAIPAGTTRPAEKLATAPAEKATTGAAE